MVTSPEPDNRPATVEDDVNALSESLNSLSKLVIEDATLPVTLGHIADFAARAIPGADGAGLTLFQDGRPDTVVSSAPFVRESDELQYRIREGPCITASREGRTVSSRSLGELFAVPAGVTVRNAQALSQTQRLAAQLGSTLQKGAIDTAALGLPFATETVTYRVAWSIEIEAHSAEEAVLAALDVLEDEASQARVFQVTHSLVDPRPARINATSVTEVIDLTPDDVVLPRAVGAPRGPYSLRPP